MRPIPTFVPERLTEAREARGLSITQLADSIGITKQSISAYEKAKHVPGLAVLEQLAQALHLPIHFFVQNSSRQQGSQIFFRSLAAASKRARVRAERRLDWLQDIIEYLKQFVDFMTPRLPQFNISDPLSLSYDKIEDIARDCRSQFAIGNGPISNIVRLLENHGIIVTRQELDTRTLDAFSTHWGHGQNPIMVLGADKDSAVRSRFDAVHELAHLVLHQSVVKLGPVHKLLEDQANRFAGAFLLPSETFAGDLSALLNLNSLLMLKAKWKTSIATMIHRCGDMGILTEDQVRRLYIRHAQKGFRTREPLDDDLQIEQPVFLKRCFELLISKGVQTREDILSGIPLASSDIEDLVGLNRGYLTMKKGTVEQFPQLRKRVEDRSQPEQSGVILPFRNKK